MQSTWTREPYWKTFGLYYCPPPRYQKQNKTKTKQEHHTPHPNKQQDNPTLPTQKVAKIRMLEPPKKQIAQMR